MVEDFLYAVAFLVKQEGSDLLYGHTAGEYQFEFVIGFLMVICFRKVHQAVEAKQVFVLLKSVEATRA